MDKKVVFLMHKKDDMLIIPLYHILTGQTDIPLSDVGLEQARLVAQRLQKESFTHMISSDLSRAKETAEAIVRTNTASSCPLNFDERIRERVWIIFYWQTKTH